MKKLFLFSSLLAMAYAPLCVIGQSNKAKTASSINSQYIKSYGDFVTIGIFNLTPTMNISMSSDDKVANGKYNSNFKGNFSSVFGFNIGYKVLGLSLGFRTPIDPATEVSMGKTEYSTLGLKVKYKAIVVRLDKRKYKGFYDANTPNFNDNLPDEKPYYIRHDMATRSYSANLLANFSWKKYSYTSSISYSERQLRSKVGFLIKTDFSYLLFSADSNFVSPEQQPFFKRFNDIRSIRSYVFKAGPGLGMNIVMFHRVYFSLEVFIMSNNLIYRYRDVYGQENKWSYNNNTFLHGGAGLGYSGERFYIGLRANGENNSMYLQGVRIQPSFGSVSFDLGFRFGAPKGLKKVWKNTATKYFGL